MIFNTQQTILINAIHHFHQLLLLDQLDALCNWQHWVEFLPFFFLQYRKWFDSNMVLHTLEQRREVGLVSTYRRCRFWQKKIIFPDESHFDLGGYVNKKNYRIFGTENSHAYIEKPTHPNESMSFGHLGAAAVGYRQG